MAADFKNILGIDCRVRLFYRYDFEENAQSRRIIDTVLSEPNIDQVLTPETFERETAGMRVIASEYLPGQYDVRADSASQCAALITGERPAIRTAQVIALNGADADAVERIKNYIINPVDSREAAPELPDTLDPERPRPDDVAVLEGFRALAPDALEALRQSQGLAMSPEDIVCVQRYFAEEDRDPTATELRVIDTYWSDHCRHTTFLTELDAPVFSPGTQAVQDAWSRYEALRAETGRDSRPVTLMDMATIGAKALKARGALTNLDESEEINACSVNMTVNHDGADEDWLLMFKNETHNHPTEIEPFGGAATCLGGAIRDPLSGRAYVYQAMRVTGAADVRAPIADTLEGKLPQRKISKEAAAGYSAYGNQIGLATGQVEEIFDPGFLAKRLEVGAVIAAAPKNNVIREVPEPGDVVLLVGGRTGRDGCGGATGSSKAHTQESIHTSGAEVQKGNPVTERKIQRLFRDPETARMIRRCNDFGAGGVAVAIGELADSLDIDLDAVPKKYDGLDGTELAISESQERMAVVVRPEDVDAFIKKGADENLEVTPVAVVTDDGRLKMRWRGTTILDLSRAFLNTNGASQQAGLTFTAPAEQTQDIPASFEDGLKERLSALGGASQKGLGEMFDSTIGAGTILAPYGGACQLTPQNGMAAKIPVEHGDTDTVSVMTYGYALDTLKRDAYAGGAESVVRALAKLIAMGADYKNAALTFQEYFERLEKDPEKWSRPAAALLGALDAQIGTGAAAIGGKDSMSGTYEELSVPPTLIAFAVAPETAGNILSAEFKKPGSPVYYMDVPQKDGQTDYAALCAQWDAFATAAAAGKILSAKTAETGGIAQSAAQMAFGNQISVNFTADLETLFKKRGGGILFEAAEKLDLPDAVVIGTTGGSALSAAGETVSLKELTEVWESGLRDVYPEKAAVSGKAPALCYAKGPASVYMGEPFAAPRIFIPAFPGTNCETDTAKAFERAGGIPEIALFRNRSPLDIEQSVAQMVKGIQNSQIIALPGGFSAGDEPDGSGKFIAAVFKNPQIADALADFLGRGGLMLGICNGFQALIKLGLLPYGRLTDLKPGMPTLRRNAVGRHVSTIPMTKVVSNQSPWLAGVEVGETFRIPMSHGEGRFTAEPELLKQLADNGQIATQYVDFDGRATMDGRFNPNGSDWAVEGITSPDGRIFGKMGHSERAGRHLYKNIPGNKDQKIFESGVNYFK